MRPILASITCLKTIRTGGIPVTCRTGITIHTISGITPCALFVTFLTCLFQIRMTESAAVAMVFHPAAGSFYCSSAAPAIIAEIIRRSPFPAIFALFPVIRPCIQRKVIAQLLQK